LRTALRRRVRPKRDEQRGDWRKLHKEEFHNLYSNGMRIGFRWESVPIAKYTSNYNDQVKEDEMGRACSPYGEKKNAYRILV
jgi:hypothetical protein